MFKKNIIACYYFGTVLCLWFLIPTLLIVDMYPFLRFGMYAEKPNKNAENEFFFVEVFENEHKILFKPQMLGFDEGHFQYIIRHFVYQQKTLQFFNQIFYYFEKIQRNNKNNKNNNKNDNKNHNKNNTKNDKENDNNNKKIKKIKCIIFQKKYFPKNKDILPKIKKIAEKEMFF